MWLNIRLVVNGKTGFLQILPHFLMLYGAFEYDIRMAAVPIGQVLKVHTQNKDIALRHGSTRQKPVKDPMKPDIPGNRTAVNEVILFWGRLLRAQE